MVGKGTLVDEFLMQRACYISSRNIFSLPSYVIFLLDMFTECN